MDGVRGGVRHCGVGIELAHIVSCEYVGGVVMNKSERKTVTEYASLTARLRKATTYAQVHHIENVAATVYQHGLLTDNQLSRFYGVSLHRLAELDGAA